MVCVFEDIDAIIQHYGDSDLLQWLDGNHQVDKAVNIATTNYPEKLDRRIISRPRRFDRILRIDAPDARMREAYIARKVPELTGPELAKWVELSSDLPFAALAELVISVCCMGNELEESALHRRAQPVEHGVREQRPGGRRHRPRGRRIRRPERLTESREERRG
jgi:SpoVK/Ycf46/Vps4 family AAA+-type ATPase